MSQLKVNLRLLYYDRSLWTWYGALILVYIFICSMVQDRVESLGDLMYPLGMCVVFGGMIAGFTIGGVGAQFLSKTFTYCLPRYDGLMRYFLMVCGLVSGFLWGLPFIFFGGTGSGLRVVLGLEAGMVVTAAFCISCCYKVYEGVRRKKRVQASRTVQLIVTLLLFWMINIFVSEYEDESISNALYEELIPVLFPVVFLFCVCSCLIVWRKLGAGELHRTMCGRMVLTGWPDPEEQQRYAESQKVELWREGFLKGGEICGKVERAFLGIMRRFRVFGGWRYVWGNAYLVWARALSGLLQWRSMLFHAVMWVIVVCFVCYMPGGIRNIILFCILPLSLIQYGALPYRNILVTAGRAERYKAAVAWIFGASVVLTGAGLLLVFLSMLLQGVAGDINIGGKIFEFRTTEVRYIYVVPILSAIILTLRTLFRRYVMLAVGAIIIAGAFTSPLWIKFFEVINFMGFVGALWLVGVCWAVVWLCLRHLCLSKDIHA